MCATGQELPEREAEGRQKVHDNRGMGAVEIILVLTVLIIFVLVFRDRIVDSAVFLCRKFIEML